mgnify:CR=1 FL=1
MASPAELVALRQSHRATLDAAIGRFNQDRNPDRLLASLSRACDRTLRSLWRLLDPPRRFSLIAIGGYGRSELFPHSDVDLLILADRPTPGEAELLERFVSACWDLGLQIGHSVRSIEECLDEARGDYLWFIDPDDLVSAGNAALLGCSDVIIATRGSNIGMGGPAMVEGGGLGQFKRSEEHTSELQSH